MADATATAETVVEIEDPDEIKVVDTVTFNAYINRGLKPYLGKVPVATSAAWYGPSGGVTFFQTPAYKQDGTATVFPLPIDKYSVPTMIFQNDEVIRVYTLPMRAPDPRPADWVERAPRRYTFTKTAPTYVVEEMTLATIAEEIVDEWVQLADEMSSADSELEKVIALVEALESEQPPGANLKEWLRKDDLIEALEAKDHRDLDDDDGEGEDEPEEIAPTGGNGGSPPAPAPSP